MSMKTVNLYLLRHGKTWFNEKEIVQGWCDSLLVPEAILEAKNKSKKMQTIPFSKVYCSPTMRARQTASLICPDLAYQENVGLMEIHYGYLEGESAKTLALFYPNRYDFENFEGFAGGESWKEAGPRFQKAISKIIEDAKDGEHILVVSHGAIITWFLHQIDASIQTKVPNLSFAHVIYNGQWSIQS